MVRFEVFIFQLSCKGYIHGKTELTGLCDAGRLAEHICGMYPFKNNLKYKLD